MTIPALNVTPVQPFNNTTNTIAFPGTLASQSAASTAADMPVKKAPKFIRMNGKSVEVKFTRTQNNIVIMRSVPQGEVLGKAPASQGFLRALEAGSLGSKIIQTGKAAGTVAAVGEGGVALGFLVTAGLVLVTAGAVLFGKTDDLTNKEPDLRTSAQKQKDALKSALTFAGVKLVGHPELLAQLQSKLGRKAKSFIARANQLSQAVKNGHIKPDNASAVLRAELEVRYLKQGNDTKTDVELPQAPSPSPNVNQPSRKFTPNPVPDVPPLSDIVIKQEVVVKGVAIPLVKVTKTQRPSSAQNGSNYGLELKRLFGMTPYHAFTGESVAQLSRETGIPEVEIHREMDKGGSPRDAVNRILARKFGYFVGASNGAANSSIYDPRDVKKIAKAINEASPQLIRKWVATLSESERNALPIPIQEVIEKILKCLESIDNLHVSVDPALLANAPVGFEATATALIKSIFLKLLEYPRTRSDVELVFLNKTSIKIEKLGFGLANFTGDENIDGRVINPRIIFDLDGIKTKLHEAINIPAVYSPLSHELRHHFFAIKEPDKWRVSLRNYAPGNDREKQRARYILDRTNLLMREEAHAHMRDWATINEIYNGSLQLVNEYFEAFKACNGNFDAPMTPELEKKIIEIVDKNSVYSKTYIQQFGDHYDFFYPKK